MTYTLTMYRIFENATESSVVIVINWILVINWIFKRGSDLERLFFINKEGFEPMTYTLAIYRIF
jgi:hypothetical protein